MADPYGGGDFIYNTPQVYGVTGGGFGGPTEGDIWEKKQQDIANQMNAATPRGGGGGGGGGVFQGGFQSPTGSFYDPTSGSWKSSPDTDLAKQKQSFAESKFNQVWGGLSGLLHGFASGGFVTPGGQSGAGPGITAGGVLTPQQIEQQVNAARATNDQSTAGRERDFSQRAAGQGFGASSPLVSAMNQSFQNANLMANGESDRSIRLGAAEKNAGQLLEGQKAQEAQYASRQQEDIQRRAPFFNTTNALISALAGLAG